MLIKLLAIAALLPLAAAAQPIASSYEGRDGRVGAVVIACPSQDGSFTAGPCPIGQPPTVNYALTGCDSIKSGGGVLYIDFTATAILGAATSLPLQPGQSFHCPYPPAGGMSAIAAQPQAFVAIRY